MYEYLYKEFDMSSSKKRHLHLPLKADLYESLRTEAQRAGVPATAGAREAISEYLTRKKREALEKAITEYAERHADSDVDLDEDLEAAGEELLLEDD
jgi:hypothetical protein